MQAQGRPARRSADLLALGWIVLVTGLYLSPALRHGTSFGPFDLGSALSGLGHTGPATYRNGWLGDEVEQFIPWAFFDWQRLSHLQFPLWNPYAGLGMPQFFNFQSSVLSLPDLVGYLFPPQAATLVAVAVKLLLAGAGAYFFCRTLGLEAWAAAFAATAFELSGAFVNEVGWPLGDVMAWTGWIFAWTYLAYRGRRPRLAAPLLAASVAFAIYGGFPEGSVLLFAGCFFFLAALALQDALAGAAAGWRSWSALAAGWAGGLCLAAPLWLPGLQVVGLSGRAVVHYQALPLRTLVMALVPKYYGSPLRADGWFGPRSYNETVVYIGIAALVAVGVALYAARGRREVWSLAFAAAVLLLLSYRFGPTAWLLARVPRLGGIALGRARLPLGFALSVLSGYGVQALLAGRRRPGVRWAFTAGVAVVGVALLALLFRMPPGGASAVSAAESRVRLWAFAWALGMLVPLVAIVPWLGRARARWLFAVLLGSETAFLLAFGVGLNVYSHRFLPETAAERELASRVGTALVGLADPGKPVTQYPGVGVLPNLNVAYGLDELAIYDPTLPRAYFSAWAGLTGTRPATGGWFVPSVTSAAVARTFGVGYVLSAGLPQAQPAAGYPARLGAALAAAGLPSATDLPALEELAAVYLARPDLQAAVPLGSGSFAGDLLARGLAMARGGAADPDGARLAPDAAALAQVAAAVRQDAGLRQAIAGMFAVPDWNGMTFVAGIGGESLWRVPGAARFSFAGPPGDRVVSARATADSAWTLTVDAPRAGRLIVRLTNVPGWHATVDDRPATLAPYLGVMQALSVPAGARVIRLWYWPRLFTVGLALAAAAAAAGGFSVATSRRRAPRSPGTAAGGR